MKYPNWLHGPDSFMDLPKNYQEYFVRLYYYTNTDETEIPDTIPVEHIENYIAEYTDGLDLWMAKGFSAACNVDKGDNLDFKGDPEFNTVVHFWSKMFYKLGVDNNWFDATISQNDFEDKCRLLRSFDIPL